MDFWQLVLLGAIAGFTIFLGLPLAVLQNVSAKKKGFLNAFAIGILIFLIIDVFSHAWESASDAATSALAGKSSVNDAVFDYAAMFGGLAISLLGLVWYESRYMPKPIMPSFAENIPKKNNPSINLESVKPSSVSNPGSSNSSSQLQQQQQLIQTRIAYKLAMMIAIGIGAHNFSEGLAIGQSYATGAIGLAIVLIVGFGSHNATEGFGIAGPLTSLVKKPNVRFLVMAGLIGGGPTFVGTIVGSLWISTIAYILFLSIAGGALIYVSMLMYNSGRRQTTNAVIMTGIFVGMCIGFITDLIVTLGGA
jgi:ZIP family zinc transporter